MELFKSNRRAKVLDDVYQCEREHVKTVVKLRPEVRVQSVI